MKTFSGDVSKTVVFEPERQCLSGHPLRYILRSVVVVAAARATMLRPVRWEAEEFYCINTWERWRLMEKTCDLGTGTLRGSSASHWY